MGAPRVVITGLGLVSPIGHTLTEFWDSIIAGHDGLRPLQQPLASSISHSVGGMIEDGVLIELGCDYRGNYNSRSGLMATIAGNMALKDAAAGRSMPACTTICIGSMFSAIAPPAHRSTHSTSVAHDASHPYQSTAMGPPDEWEWISQGSVSGLVAICRGADLIRLGHQQIVVAGGVDTPFEFPHVLGPLFEAGQSSRRFPSRRAIRHADRHAPVFTPGEGAAMVVLESRDHALARGARIYSEWLGWAGRMSDASSVRDETADQAQAMVIRRACGHSRATIESISLCCLTGLGIPEHDRVEWDAVHAVWPESAQAPYSATISPYTGHVFAAGGPLHIIMASLAIEKATLPSCSLPTATEMSRFPTHHDKWSGAETRRALILGSGFGGYCVAAVLSALTAAS